MIVRLVAAYMVMLAASPCWAWEGLTDEALAESVGQAGVTFVSSPITVAATDMFWYDTDGGAAPYANPARINLRSFNQSLAGLTVDFDVGSQGTASTSRTAMLLRMGFSDLDVGATLAIESGTGGNSRSFGDLVLSNLALTNGVFLINPKGDAAAGGAGTSGVTLTYANVQQLDGQVSFTDTSATGTSISQSFTVTGLDLSGSTIDVAGTGATDGAGIKVKLSASAPTNLNLNISSLAIGGTSAGSINMTGFNLANTELTLRGR